MSYFTLNEDNLGLRKQDNQQISNADSPKGRHHVPHSEEAKKRISQKQKQRYKLINQLVKKGRENSITEERVEEITRNVLEEYLKKHIATPINNKPININL